MAQDVSITFRKMNGLGNEIVVLDLRGRDVAVTPEQAARIAENPRTRFDQLMVLSAPRSAGTLAYVTIFNTDGSVAGACGNGMRCVGLTVHAMSGQAHQTFETEAGLLHVDVDGPDRIAVDMGRPRFGWEDIPLRDPFADTRRIELQIGPIDDPILHTPSVCSMGNPHAIFWVDDVDAYDLKSVGWLLENHPIFPEGANISLCQVISPTRARLRTWERGAGMTQACGSAACAALVSGVRLERLERSAEIIVPGGPLSITWRADDHVIMTGPAELEYEGSVIFHTDGCVTVT